MVTRLRIIIPTIRIDSLKKSLDSILRQIPIVDIFVRIVIVYDGSLLNPPEYKEESPFYKVTSHQINYTGNPARAVNDEMQYKHDFIMHWFDDDLMLPNSISALLKGAENGADVICGCVESKEFSFELKNLYGRYPDKGLRVILSKNFMPLQGLLIRGDFFRKLKGFNEKFKYTYDWDFSIRCCMYGQLAFIFDKVALWLPSDDGMIGSYMGLNTKLTDAERKEYKDNWNLRRQELGKEWEESCPNH